MEFLRALVNAIIRSLLRPKKRDETLKAKQNSYMEDFVLFLKYLNINFETYKNLQIVSKDGETYLLSQITPEQIKKLDWVYELAKHRELFVLDYKDNITDVIKQLNKFQKGKFARSFRFADEVLTLECCKDMGKLINDLHASIYLKNSYSDPIENILIYFENNDENKFLLGVITNSGGRGRHVSKSIELEQTLANKLGIKIFNAQYFPKVDVGLADPKDYTSSIYKDILISPKKLYYEKRNEQEIFKAKAKFKEKSMKLLPEEVIKDLNSGFFKNVKFSMKKAKTCKQDLLKRYKSEDAERYQLDFSNMSNLIIEPLAFPDEIIFGDSDGDGQKGLVFFARDEFGHGKFGIKYASDGEGKNGYYSTYGIPNGAVVYEENDYIDRVQILAKDYKEFKTYLIGNTEIDEE